MISKLGSLWKLTRESTNITNYLIMESGKIVAILNQSETTQDHEMTVDGTKLRETKVLDNFTREGEADPYQTTLVHTRWINDQFYKVEEVTEITVTGGDRDHEMMVDDTKLKETKVLDHLIREGEENPYQITLVHTKWINDHF